MAQTESGSAAGAGDSQAGQPARPAHHALLFATRRVRPRTWWLAAGVGAVLVSAIVATLVFSGFEWSRVIRAVEALRPGPLLVAMMVLPLVGFPIVPVYLVAGARFGAWGGGLVVALVTAAHLLGSFVIARTVLRGPLERRLVRWQAHLPQIPRDEEAAVAVIAVLVPGLPYVVRNYLLAMAGIRFAVFFWVCLPIHVIRSYVSILVGDMGADPDGRRLVMLVAIEGLQIVICGVVLWWLRGHHRRVHPAGAGG
ncbi:VTT domain-containing protein [Opitutus sp. ER46]|uniref:TVP38/TMEM64 family protein n=1 Tax=Opitutus sp. ER46 TaxID=2161864 RepID=UPI0011B1D274|nr:VTT domain-containing protein [Opitutus sp. ER46]